MRLNRNFTLSEMTYSQTATRLKIDNTLPSNLVGNVIALALFLQKLRNALSHHFGKDTPVIVTSGYRSHKLNKKIGGSKRSAHMLALAADIKVPNMTPLELAKFIKDNMREVDQVIVEFDQWVHVAIASKNSKSRNIYLRASKARTRFGRTKTIYEPLIFD